MVLSSCYLEEALEQISNMRLGSSTSGLDYMEEPCGHFILCLKRINRKVQMLLL